MADMTAMTAEQQLREDLMSRATAHRTAAAMYTGAAARALLGEADFLDSVAARLSGMAAVPQWQSMESAPRDGREVLLAVKFRAGIPHGLLVAHYMGGGYCIEDHPAIAAGWYFWNGCMFDRAAEPTAWMPLPAHPDWEPGGWQYKKQGIASPEPPHV